MLGVIKEADVGFEEESERICDGDNDDDFVIISEAIVETDRWTTLYDIVIQRKSDLTCWMGWCRRGSTEMQEGSEQFCEAFFKVQLVPEIAYVWKKVK